MLLELENHLKTQPMQMWRLFVQGMFKAYDPRNAGEVPFKSTSILGLYKEICEALLEFMDDVFISDSLKHLLRRLLDKNPDSRMTLTAVMTHPWVTYNGELPLLPVSMVGQTFQLYSQ